MPPKNARKKKTARPRKRFEQQPLPLTPKAPATAADAPAPAEAPAAAPSSKPRRGRPPAAEQRVKFSVILDAATVEQLRARAEAAGHTELAPVVRVAIRRYLAGSP